MKSTKKRSCFIKIWSFLLSFVWVIGLLYNPVICQADSWTYVGYESYKEGKYQYYIMPKKEKDYLYRADKNGKNKKILGIIKTRSDFDERPIVKGHYKNKFYLSYVGVGYSYLGIYDTKTKKLERTDKPGIEKKISQTLYILDIGPSLGDSCPHPIYIFNAKTNKYKELGSNVEGWKLAGDDLYYINITSGEPGKVHTVDVWKYNIKSGKTKRIRSNIDNFYMIDRFNRDYIVYATDPENIGSADIIMLGGNVKKVPDGNYEVKNLSFTEATSKYVNICGKLVNTKTKKSLSARRYKLPISSSCIIEVVSNEGGKTTTKFNSQVLKAYINNVYLSNYDQEVAAYKISVKKGKVYKIIIEQW